MFLLYVILPMFWFSILEYRNSDVKVSYFPSVFVDVCLNFIQFIICIDTPENTRLLEYLNTHETIITNCFDTHVIISVKFFCRWTLFPCGNHSILLTAHFYE